MCPVRVDRADPAGPPSSRGERDSSSSAKRSIFREFVTVHRGTAGGGGVTRIGDRNVFMAYVHVAHDCHVGDDTIFGNMATLGGHVAVEDFANVSAGSGVSSVLHRVGRFAFIGGYSVITKDALPFARTRFASRPARICSAKLGWPDAPRVSFGIHSEAPEAFVPLPAAVETTERQRTRSGGSIRTRQLACADVSRKYLLDFIRAPRSAA